MDFVLGKSLDALHVYMYMYIVYVYPIVEVQT